MMIYRSSFSSESPIGYEKDLLYLRCSLGKDLYRAGGNRYAEHGHRHAPEGKCSSPGPTRWPVMSRDLSKAGPYYVVLHQRVGAMLLGSLPFSFEVPALLIGWWTHM